MLYVFPPLFILAAWAWGCRESDHSAVLLIAAVCAAAFVPVFAIAVESEAVLVDGSAYALAVMTTSACAMLLRTRTDPEERGGDDGDAPGPTPGDDPSDPSIDWDDFECRYWEEVRRRERDPVPG